MENLVELKREELSEIDGGFWQLIAVAIAVEIMGDWDNFKAGLAGDPPLS